MSLLSLVGGAVGLAIAGPGGAALGAAAGSQVSGGGAYPTENIPIQTPHGTLTYVYTGDPSKASVCEGIVFGQWAAAGNLAWLASIASTGSGPDWRNGGQSTFSGYGSYDRSFAGQLVAAYGAATPVTAPTGTGAAGTPITFGALANVVAGAVAAPAVAGSTPFQSTTAGQILGTVAGAVTQTTQSVAQAQTATANTSLLIFAAVALLIGGIVVLSRKG